MTLVIRRMRCEECARIHHELPDMLVPYKRYESASIERVVGEPNSVTDVAADESTLRRWKAWFVAWSNYASGCLSGISSRFHLPVQGSPHPSQTSFQALARFVGNAAGWLARVVQPISNENLWVHTRSAFMSA